MRFCWARAAGRETGVIAPINVKGVIVTSGKKDFAGGMDLNVIAAMRAIDPDGVWYSLGQVGQYITQANPDFDTRTYGSAKLSDLVRKISRFEVMGGPAGQLLARDVA